MSHYEQIWWLEENSVGMPKPPIDEIPSLYKNGLRAVASFLESDDNLQEYRDNNIETCWIPVEDDEAPTSKLKNAPPSLKKQKTKTALAVHCKGGNGRAGTMLASYYTLQGKDADEVLAWMRSINPKAVRTETQEKFLSL